MCLILDRSLQATLFFCGSWAIKSKQSAQLKYDSRAKGRHKLTANPRRAAERARGWQLAHNSRDKGSDLRLSRAEKQVAEPWDRPETDLIGRLELNGP